MNSYMKHNKLWLLFLGRLETEKGFDLIFDFINQYPEKELPFEIYIFWSWSYEEWVLELSHRFKDVHYFWWKPLSDVERYLENIDYCLMPSRFIETFWLSAINVLKWGIPVVGFKKWWLVPFIPDEYKPITMWGYFGYELLFSIPCVGFIILLVFAFGGNKNINVKNFARSYFCYMIIAAVAFALFFFVFGGAAIFASYNN